MALDFKSHMFQALAQIPSYSDWLLDTDLTSTYRYERRVLKLLQWGCPERPWRLKCPTHLIYLEHLNRAFPDACFVMTHREPSEVMLSVIDVYCDIVGKFTDQVDTQYLAELNIQHWSEGMRRALTFRAKDDNNTRFYDIDFRAMHHEPVAAVRGLYRCLGETESAEFETGMARWSTEKAQERQSGARGDAAGYGVDLERVRTLTAQSAAWTSEGREA